MVRNHVLHLSTAASVSIISSAFNSDIHYGEFPVGLRQKSDHDLYDHLELMY